MCYLSLNAGFTPKQLMTCNKQLATTNCISLLGTESVFMTPIHTGKTTSQLEIPWSDMGCRSQTTYFLYCLVILVVTAAVNNIPSTLSTESFHTSTCNVVSTAIDNNVMCMCVTLDGGFGLNIWFTDRVNTQLVITLNYSAITHSTFYTSLEHTL
jgi:hypothetical protein